jgi:hypothetical protein
MFTLLSSCVFIVGMLEYRPIHRILFITWILNLRRTNVDQTWRCYKWNSVRDLTVNTENSCLSRSVLLSLLFLYLVVWGKWLNVCWLRNSAGTYSSEVHAFYRSIFFTVLHGTAFSLPNIYTHLYEILLNCFDTNRAADTKVGIGTFNSVNVSYINM